MALLRVSLAILLCGLLAVPGTPARAQDYPARPVTIVNPFAPGGGTDLLARMLAQQARAAARQELHDREQDRAPARSSRRVTVQKSAPDGYTLLMAPAPTMAVNVSLYKSLPYEPLTDFVPLALLAQTPFVLMVNPDLPVKSVPELIAYAKANAGKMTFASVGPGVPHHLFMEIVQEHDRHPGVARALSRQPAGAERCGRRPRPDDVLRSRPGGRPARSPARCARSASPRRFRVPAIPTSRRSPKPACPASTRCRWQMMVAPAKTPRPIVDKLNRELDRHSGDAGRPRSRSSSTASCRSHNRSVEELQDFVKSEIARWGKVVQRRRHRRLAVSRIAPRVAETTRRA